MNRKTDYFGLPVRESHAIQQDTKPTSYSNNGNPFVEDTNPFSEEIVNDGHPLCNNRASIPTNNNNSIVHFEIERGNAHSNKWNDVHRSLQHPRYENNSQSNLINDSKMTGDYEQIQYGEDIAELENDREASDTKAGDQDEQYQYIPRRSNVNRENMRRTLERFNRSLLKHGYGNEIVTVDENRPNSVIRFLLSNRCTCIM
jgi:hypothetical protein